MLILNLGRRKLTPPEIATLERRYAGHKLEDADPETGDDLNDTMDGYPTGTVICLVPSYDIDQKILDLITPGQDAGHTFIAFDEKGQLKQVVENGNLAAIA